MWLLLLLSDYYNYHAFGGSSLTSPKADDYASPKKDKGMAVSSLFAENVTESFR